MGTLTNASAIKRPCFAAACSGGSLTTSTLAMHTHNACAGGGNQKEIQHPSKDEEAHGGEETDDIVCGDSSSVGHGCSEAGNVVGSVHSCASGPKLVSLRSMQSNKFSSSLAETEESMMHSFQQAEGSRRIPMHAATVQVASSQQGPGTSSNSSPGTIPGRFMLDIFHTISLPHQIYSSTTALFRHPAALLHSIST